MLTIDPGNRFDESFASAIPETSVDSLKIRYTVCWKHPTDRQWNRPLVHRADGSYGFADVAKNFRGSPGLFCTFNRRGEPFAL